MASAHLLLALSILFALSVHLVTNEEVDAIPAALVPAMIRHTLLPNVRAGFDNGDFWRESYIILPDLNETVQSREEIERALKVYGHIATFFERSEEPDDKKLFVYMKWAITLLAKLRIKITETEHGTPLDVELRTCQQDDQAESGNPCKLLAKIKDHIQMELAKGDILGKLGRAAEHGWQHNEIQRILLGMHALILHAVIYRKMLEGVQQKVRSLEEKETGKMMLDNAEQNKQAMQAPKMEFEKDWLEQMIKTLEDRYHDYRAIFNRKLVFPIDNSIEKKLMKHLAKLDTMIKPNDEE